jgi:tetratricopeptide (TPR) repeat protein/photosystem II stability/assembly factor-like uncharacterized protein
MDEIINPYIAGAPVTGTQMFFGREDVFQWVENSVTGKYADSILVIHGQRRVGKTSVLKQLGNRLPKRHIPVFFDLSGRTHTTLDRFLWWLSREIVRVLKQERNYDIPLPEKEAFINDNEYFEHQFLPGVVSVIGNQSLLLTFDEFDNLEESEIKEELAVPLVDYLRRLMGNPSINFIFSIGSSGRKLENMQASYTDFFKTALYKKISFLSHDETARLITRPVEGLITYHQKAVDRIFEITYGHAYFTQLLCHELFSLCQRTGQRNLRDEDVESILDDVVERGTVNLKFVWDDAADLEKWVLAGLAQMEKAGTRLLSEFLRQQRVRFSEADLTSALLRLREKDVLTEDHRFVIQLLKLWLTKNRPIEQVREELTEINPIANRYIEIGLEYKNSRLYEKAIENFQEALSVDADNLQAQVDIALVYMDQKLFEKAVVEFEKVLVIDDEDVAARTGLCDAHLALGDAALEKRRTREAMQSYQRVLGINAEHIEARQRMAEIHRARAEKLLVDGHDEESLAAFGEALRFTPEEPLLIARVDAVRAEKRAKVIAGFMARVEKEEVARNWERALSLIREALAIAPGEENLVGKAKSIQALQTKERLEALLAKVSQAEKSERWDTAIATLNEYLTFQPDDELTRSRLEQLIKTKHAAWLKAILSRSEQAVVGEHWEEAIAALNEVMVLEPENGEVQQRLLEVKETQREARMNAVLARANLAEAAKQWDQAIAVLKEYLLLQPEDVGIQKRVAAVREKQRIARMEAFLARANQAATAKQWDQAVIILNEYLAIQPGEVKVQQRLTEVAAAQRQAKLEAMLNRASQAEAAKQWDQIIAILQEYLVLQPGDENTRKRIDSARKEQRLAQFAALRSRAQRFERAEKYSEALAAWDEYLKLDPEDKPAILTQIETVRKNQILALEYAEAQQALAGKHYDKAIGLLKKIVVENALYKDASAMMAQAIELRRTSPKFWQSKLLWGGLGGVLAIGLSWVLLRPGSPVLSALLDSNTPTFTSTASPVSSSSGTTIPGSTATIIATATQAPTAIPLAWERLNSGQFLPRDMVTAIVIDPNDPGIMYAGTEDAGIYKSIDGGISWQPAQKGLERANVSTLIIDPKIPSTLYAGVVLGGIYKSVDGAASWFPINSGIDLPGGEWLSIVVMDPKDSKHLYFTQRTSLYESLDGGESWITLKKPACMPDDISNLAVDPQDGQTLYITEFTGGHEWRCPKGIFVSNDHGQNWLEIAVPMEEGEWMDRSLAIDPGNAGNIYISGGGSQILYASKDNGATWKKFTDFGCRYLAFDPANSKRVFCGADRGLWKTENAGASWARVSTPEANPFKALAFVPQSTNAIYAGGQGLLYSADNGVSWNTRESGLGGSILELMTDPAHTTNIIAIENISTSYWNAFTSSDNGRTWVAQPGDVNSLIPKALTMGDCNPVLPFWSGDGKMGYAIGCNTNTPFRSQDSGKTWQTCGIISVDPFNWVSRSLSRIAIDTQDSNNLALALRGGGILKSTDGCQTWRLSNSGLGSLFVNTIAMDPQDSNKMYAGTDGGAYLSIDGGDTWGAVNDGLLNATVVYSIVVDSNSKVFASTPYGIFLLKSKSQS